MNKKKNLLWLLSLLMIVSVSFTSCNKDDDDDDVVSVADLKTALIGTWKELSDELYLDNKVVEDESIYHDDKNYYEYEFKSDGTYVNRKYEDGKMVETYDYSGTWTLNGDQLKFDNDSEIQQVIIKGNTLILSSDDGSFTDDKGVKHGYKIVCTYTKQ